MVPAKILASEQDQKRLFDNGQVKPLEEDFVLPEEPKPHVDLTVALPFEKLTGAVLDDTRTYRYVLWRRIREKGEKILWIGLNPSTADEDTDDPTIRRVVDYSKQWGFATVLMANLFAFRATRPEDMKKAADPVGPENLRWLQKLRADSKMCVAAYGNNGCHRWAGRRTLKMLVEFGPLYCLGITKGGHPRHPLYLKKSLKPQLLKGNLADAFEES